MVNVNRKYLDDVLKREICSKFLKRIGQIKSEEQLGQLLRNLFTPAERIMLEKRLAATHLIEAGLTYRKIAQAIDISPATISFVKGGLKNKPTSKIRYSSMSMQKSRNKFSNSRNILSKLQRYKGTGRW